MTESGGWIASDQPLTARFHIAIPSFASLAGKRLLVPSLLFNTLQRGLFTSDYRQYPISFSYPFGEKDEVTIKLPAGYSMEAPPDHRKAGLSYAAYELASTAENNELTTRRSLRFDGVNFPPEKYAELKEFFNIVERGDTEQCVLHTGGDATAATKTN